MAEYLGVPVVVPSNDPEHLGFLREAGERRLSLQQCADCGKLRYPPGTACTFCTALESTWQPVSGKGTIYSYEIVAQAINPVYLRRTPYPVVLVELDEQRGYPTEHDGLRIISSLVDANGNPEDEERVAIGLRVEVEFADLGDGLALPRFRLSSEPPESTPWRYAG